jgi:hypothetical protein
MPLPSNDHVKKDEENCMFIIPYWPMDTTSILMPRISGDGRHAGYRKKASKMRQYLELKTHDTMQAFCEYHNVRTWKSISTSSVLAFPHYP